VHATRVFAAGAVSGGASSPAPGEVVVADKSRVVVACAVGLVELVTVQPEGKRAMAAFEWATGRGVAAGDVLGA